MAISEPDRRSHSSSVICHDNNALHLSPYVKSFVGSSISHVSRDAYQPANRNLEECSQHSVAQKASKSDSASPKVPSGHLQIPFDSESMPAEGSPERGRAGEVLGNRNGTCEYEKRYQGIIFSSNVYDIQGSK